jgi:predicted RNase H-like HicB family nuclease
MANSTDEFVAGVTFQRETFTSQGKTGKEAEERLQEHIEAVLPLFQWQIEHAQNIVADMTRWLNEKRRS